MNTPTISARDSRDDEKPLRIRRGRVDSVDLFEIKDSELDVLEKGSPADLQLNFAVFLLSIAFSAVCALATATFSNVKVQTTFLVVAVVGILIGVYLLIAWYRTRSSLRDLCRQIRNRMPPDVLPSPSSVAAEDLDDTTRPAG